MNHTAHKRRAHKGRRHNNGFAPAFGSIINEILNSPLHEVVSDKPKKYTYPAANIVKIDNQYQLSLAIPGVAKEDVSISIDKNKLVIKSEVEDKSEIKFRLREFNYAKFKRAFTLSDDADIDNISAKFDNGILHVSIPTIKEAGPVKVEIA